MTHPSPHPGRLPALVSRGLGFYMSYSRRLVDVVRPRRTRTGMPSVEDFRRVGPERTVEWLRMSGVEARVLTAMAEADGVVHETPDPDLPILEGSSGTAGADPVEVR